MDDKRASVKRHVAYRLATVRWCAALFCCAWLTAGTAPAAEVPNTDVQVDLLAREQPVAEFIAALFREIGVPAIVSDELEGVVNGRFDGSAGDVLGELSNAFDVLFYHDGTVTHVYRSNELTRKVVPLVSSRVERAGRSVARMALPDAANRIVEEDGALLVIGVPRFVEQVEQVVASVAGPAEVRAPAPPVPAPVAPEEGAVAYRVFRLTHAWAEDTSFRVGGRDVVVPGVATIVGNLISEDPIAYDVARRTSVPLDRSLDGLRGQGLAGANTPRSATGDTVATGVGGVSKGVMRVVADSRLNAVIVRDTQERMPAYAALIESLDVESGMVEIEATIIDINTDKTRELGINWRGTFDDDAAIGFEGGQSGTGSLTPPGRGGILSLALGERADFLARIRLLEESGAARVVSKPHVITLSDVEAVLGATTEFFIRVAGLEQVDLFNVPVGTLLRVTPHVFEEGRRRRIKLLVNIEDGSQSGSQVDNIPVVERANISTQAVIDDGDSLLVGGLVRDTYVKRGYRVPVLGSIPLLGRLFRSDRESATRVERLFMITPRLARGGGFGSDAGLPRLEGDQNVLVSDAGDRLDALQWPPREEPAYWPEEGAGTTSPSNAPKGAGAVRVGTPELVAAPRRPVSRFSVERW